MAIFTVGPTSVYPTIADAMLAANPGDTIQLESGYGNETAIVTHGGMTISGDVNSTGVVLQLAPGIALVTLAGTAPIQINDGADGNTINGNDGNNIISVSSGVDVVNAGNGNDRLIIDYSAATAAITGTPVNVTDGGTHAVTFTGVENFTISTGSGNDTVTVGDGFNVLNTNAGNDTITAGNGPNTISGGAGNDTITAGDGGNTINGGAGDDGITTGSGNDFVNAGVGNDTVITGGGADVTTVNGGIDTVDSGSEADRLIVDYSSSTTAVNGSVTGGTLAGGYDGAFADLAGTSSVVFHNTENFTVITGSDNDVITTGDGADVLDGGAGSDQLNSGGGNDTLLSGLGNDALDGGNGTDTVIFSGARSDYQVNDLGNGVLQTIDLRSGSPDGTDTLVNMESFSFTDGTFDAVTVLAVAPATLVTSLAFSADTGVSNSDFITNTAAQTISGTLGANLVNGERVEVSLDGGSTWTTASSSVGSNAFSLAGQTLAGDNVLKARVSNVGGDGTATSQAYVLDTSVPAQPATPVLSAVSDSGTLGDGITNDTTPTVTGTAEAGSTVTLYDTDGTTVLGTGVANGSGAYSITSSALTAGGHTLSVKATDAAGNTSVVSSGFVATIDTTAPGQPSAPTLVTASDSGTLGDGITNDTTPTVTGTAEAGSTVTLYDTDGTTVLGTGVTSVGGSYSITSSALTAGSHTLSLKATDAAGNTSVVSSGFVATIDTTAPGQPSAPVLASASDGGTPGDGLTNVASPTVTGTAEARSTVTLYDTNGTTVLGTALADATTGAYSITSTALSAGVHTLTVKAADLSANVSAASVGLALTIDTAAPTLAITTNASQLRIGESAAITFAFSDDPGSSFVWDGSSGDVVVSGGTLGAISGSGLVRTATFTPTPDTNGGTASIAVAAGAYADTAGNHGGAGATPSLHFDTRAPNAPSTPDLAVGSDSGLSNTDSITSVTTPTFGGTAENGSTVTLYDTDGTTELGSGVVSGGTWSIATSALGEGAHTISARVTDAAGNRGALSSGLPITIDTTPPAGPGVALAHDTGVSSIDHVTSNPQINYSGDNGATLLYRADAAASFSSIVPTFTTEGLHTVLVEQRDAAGNIGAAASLSFTLDTVAPHLTGITASPGCGNGTAGSTVHFTLAFDEAINVTGGTPTLTLNDGATTVFNGAATAALHDATKLAFDYLVSSGDAVTPSLAITGFVSHGATVDDLAGNHANLSNVAAAFAALSVNEPVGTILPAFTFNGFTRPALQLDTTGHIMLDEAASNWVAAYGLKALYLGVPESTPYPPVADTHHLSDCHLM